MMRGGKYRLRATKASMYELTKRHFGMKVKRRDTEFIKYPGTRNYAMNFWQDGVEHHFLLTSSNGKSSLCHEAIYSEEDSRSSEWTTEDIILAELLELGMAEEIGE